MSKKHYIYYVRVIFTNGDIFTEKTVAASRIRAVIRTMDKLKCKDVKSIYVSGEIPKVQRTREEELRNRNLSKIMKKKHKERQIWWT